MALKVKREMDTINASYSRLQKAPMVTKLNTTLEELVWAFDVASSRSFLIPNHWTELLTGTSLSMTQSAMSTV